ncbi:MAG: TauD/TfdA dioxygenase family protein [Candidatus Azotimanducaceae bacterium]
MRKSGIDNADRKRFSYKDARSLNAELLTGQTGVRITGVSVSEMSDQQVTELKTLISEYCVAVLPSQPLLPEDQLSFVGRLDPITFTPGEQRHPQWPNLNVVSLSSTSTLPPINGFHTDTSFVRQPPSYTTLSPKKISSHGGDTVFVNQYMAYEALSPVMQGMLTGLRFRHNAAQLKHLDEAPSEPVWHPAVRTHPITGRKAIYITQPKRCSEVEGMKPKESKHLLEFLYAHCQHIYSMYRHRWKPDDFVIWDNRCSMHTGVFDHGDEERVMHRVMCQGEAPYES